MMQYLFSLVLCGRFELKRVYMPLQKVSPCKIPHITLPNHDKNVKQKSSVLYYVAPDSSLKHSCMLIGGTANWQYPLFANFASNSCISVPLESGCPLSEWSKLI